MAEHDPAIVEKAAEDAARLYLDFGHVWDREPDGTWVFDGSVAREVRDRHCRAARKLLDAVASAIREAEKRRAAELGGRYYDVLDAEIAESIRSDRVYVEAHDRSIREAVLLEAAERIEDRRLQRRRNWLRKHRWSGEVESRWSLGMWDAARIVRNMATQLREEHDRG